MIRVLCVLVKPPPPPGPRWASQVHALGLQDSDLADDHPLRINTHTHTHTLIGPEISRDFLVNMKIGQVKHFSEQSHVLKTGGSFFLGTVFL